jgi:aryl-alcohol dehydrogenase-like predicted oxidoreductase
MKYRYLGRTGVRVSSLCLGTLMIGPWGGNTREDSLALIGRALDEGINYIDTADSYSRGEAEHIIGAALAKPSVRDRVVLATKVYSPMGVDPNARGLSRRWILHEVEQSLRRLNTDRIDLYQVHRPDPATDLDETIDALSDLVHAGKIRYFGTSTFPAHLLVEAQWSAQRSGRCRPVCEQPPYSLLAREIEADVLPCCRKYHIGAVVWSPLAGGWLSGRYRAGVDVAASARGDRWPLRYDLSLEDNQRKLVAVERLTLLAAEAGLTLIELAIAFTLHHADVTAAIIGPRTIDHLESQFSAADVVLDDDLLDRIDKIVPPGTTLNPADGGWKAPELTDSTLRRRRT